MLKKTVIFSAILFCLVGLHDMHAMTPDFFSTTKNADSYASLLMSNRIAKQKEKEVVARLNEKFEGQLPPHQISLIAQDLIRGGKENVIDEPGFAEGIRATKRAAEQEDIFGAYRQPDFFAPSNARNVSSLLRKNNVFGAYLQPGFFAPGNAGVVSSVLTKNTIAFTMGVSLATFAYLTSAYGGVAPAVVAWRYDIPRGRDALLLKAAYKQDKKQLKRDIELANETLLGENWRELRPKLVDDFVAFSRIRFTQKHGAELREKILSLLNLYGAAGSLYFKHDDIRTYLQPYFFTTSSSKRDFMEQLDQELGI